MTAIDNLKIQSDHVLRAKRVVDDLEMPLACALTYHSPKSELAAGWLVQAIALLVTQTLYTIASNDARKTRILVEAVRDVLARDFIIEED